jgi:hypothetical protein
VNVAINPEKEKPMNRRWFAALALVAVAAVAGAFVLNVSAAGKSDEVVVASLVNEMNALSLVELEQLAAIPPKPYTLPESGVDVMRVKLDEAYTIDGIGSDNVELTGWIAVTHGKPSTSNWATAVTDTQFIALNLEGNSKLFGKVKITLDSTRPAVGQVGNIIIPEIATVRLAAANDRSATTETGDAAACDETQADSRDASASCEIVAVCRAPVAVNVSMPDLGLEMTTKDHAVWFSEVTTIPPVGHEASVTVDPIRMVSNGREVGTLVSGIVKFREIVRHLPLSGKVTTMVASK